MPGREDIDALEAAIRRCERRVLDQMEETSAQLSALEAKIDRLGRRRNESRAIGGGNRRGRQRPRAEAPARGSNEGLTR